MLKDAGATIIHDESLWNGFKEVAYSVGKAILCSLRQYNFRVNYPFDCLSFGDLLAQLDYYLNCLSKKIIVNINTLQDLIKYRDLCYFIS